MTLTAEAKTLPAPPLSTQSDSVLEELVIIQAAEVLDARAFRQRAQLRVFLPPSD